MISIMADNKELPVKWITFSDGAVTCKIDPSVRDAKQYIALTVDPATPVSNVISELSLITDAIGNLPFKPRVTLFMPYLPYGRADRVFEDGNPAPLHLFQEQLSKFQFSEVIVVDPHNQSVLNSSNIHYTVISQDKAFAQSIRHFYWNYVIAPDKGAKDKASHIAETYGVPCIQATKVRDITTGRITETTLDADIPFGSRVVIIDDICDGGGTFIPLAEKLKEHGCFVDLYVTHLIAAKGLGVFKGLVDNIYCYQTVGNFVNNADVMNFNLGK